MNSISYGYFLYFITFNKYENLRIDISWSIEGKLKESGKVSNSKKCISLYRALSSVFPVIIRVLTKTKLYRQVSRCAAAPDNKLCLADPQPLVGCTVGQHRVASPLWVVWRKIPSEMEVAPPEAISGYCHISDWFLGWISFRNSMVQV